MELQCVLQHYEWGKCGESSAVALLHRATNPQFKIDHFKSYAELWMGTHPNGPSIIRKTGEALGDWIASHPESLGSNVNRDFGGKLPFLFKVLSVQKPLSIQAHPDKETATRLHATQPQLYKDPNHKPEMALALTPFRALCGFRPIHEIKRFMQMLPELQALIGEDKVKEFLHANEEFSDMQLKSCFHSLMTSSQEKIEASLKTLITRLQNLSQCERVTFEADLVEELFHYFPYDVGVFGAFLFNHLTLQTGEAIYLPANEPHAYLSGDCVECMACSDNTIRAGLTPKFKDIETLCHILSYKCESAETKRFPGLREDANTTLFSPSVSDFAVASIVVPAGPCYKLIPRNSASICLVVAGSANTSVNLLLNRGTIFFLAANEEITVSVLGLVSLELFQALANV